MNLCMVAGCRYLAESSFDEFSVCALHDHPNVRAMLDRLERPAAYYWSSGHPIVMPCGPLEVEHLAPVAAPEEVARAADATDWPLVEAPESEPLDVREEFRL